MRMGWALKWYLVGENTVMRKEKYIDYKDLDVICPYGGNSY